MHMKISSAKRQSFCPGGDELMAFLTKLISTNQLDDVSIGCEPKCLVDWYGENFRISKIYE